MRWFPLIFLAAALLVLQSTVAPRLEVLGARPDWVLVVVVFLAMHAASREGIIASWMIGLCADLMTLERLGFLAVSYGLVAMAVASVRDYLFRRRAMTQFVTTLVACLMVRLAWTVYVRVLYDPGEGVLMSLGVDVLLASVYTALWAPIVHPVLLRLSRAIGLPQPRYTYTG
jgi:rod shape-determining protein MreD